MSTSGMRVYWANAMFSEADRAFNAQCAERLRAAGYTVFLPQETAENASATPSADGIFRQDSAEILKSDLVVACLDQEAIDAGVSCEIGLAYAGGVPLIGLYTDIRQRRIGAGHMYKNLYVVGALMASAGIVSSVDDLLATLTAWPSQGRRTNLEAGLAVDYFSAAAADYEPFVARLESWYDPHWSPLERAAEFVERKRCRRVLEIGCGTGALGGRLAALGTLSYVGLDAAAGMLEIARGRNLGASVTFTDSLDLARSSGPYDAAIAAFTLHDHADPAATLAFALEALSPGGRILVLDLSTSDLPELVRRLRRALASPGGALDGRIEPSAFWQTVRRAGGSVEVASWHVTQVRFPDYSDLDRYLQIFGIYEGNDLPLGLSVADSSRAREVVRREIASWRFPFVDSRCFAEVVIGR